jgi:hypothetical protein
LRKNVDGHLSDLKNKHQAATKHFDGLKKTAEDGRKALEAQHSELKSTLNN